MTAAVRYDAPMSKGNKPGSVTPARSDIFTDAQIRLLVETVAKHRRRFKNQAELAAALGLSQPALSNLIHGKWAPGIRTAQAIAQLDGYADVAGLIGPIVPQSKGSAVPSSALSAERYPNLEACIAYWAPSKVWSPWTVAAARAGYWGDADLSPQDWAGRLDELERILENGRKAR